MRGGDGGELGSSPWELSTTGEELVWRRKTKGKRETWGEVRQQAAWPECSESHHLRWLQYSDQSLQKESSPRNACLSFMSLHLRRPRQQKAGTKSPRVSTKETYDEVCAGESSRGGSRCPSSMLHPPHSISQLSYILKAFL